MLVVRGLVLRRHGGGSGRDLHIFQLMFQRSGGTAKARTQFQNQFEAVARETALALIFVGNISEGYVQDVGPQVVAKLQTKR